MARRSAWPPALSRARGFRVYRSGAETLDQKKRAVQALVFSQEGQQRRLSLCKKMKRFAKMKP